MTGIRSKETSIMDFDEKRSAATQRILDSMPAAVEVIKAEREREARIQRQVIREREKSKMVATR